jgi:hypothetical protein
MPSVQQKRGTRAQINTAATASGLKQGEVYLITDEARLAVGTAVNTYEAFAKFSEAVAGFTMTQAAYTLANNTASQRIFNGSTNGALTLTTGTYVFELMMHITGMNTGTSGNVTFNLVGAGTATIGAAARSLMQSVGVDNSTPGNPVALNGFGVPGQINGITPLHITTTGSALSSRIHGAFDMTGGSTLIPSISLTTAAAAVVQPGSYFLIRRIANTATATVGSWS